jgi:hypothetical protein
MNPRLKTWQGAILHKSSEPVASARARWLAELDQALDEADRLAIQLGEVPPQSDELVALRARIVAVRSELDTLRRNGIGEIRREIGPNWTNLPPWRGNLVEQPKA